MSGVNIGIDQMFRERRKHMRIQIRDWVHDSMVLKQQIYNSEAVVTQITGAAQILIDALCVHGPKILVCGNGGSSSDSAHFVGELMNRFTLLRDYPLPAIDLSAMNSTITAIANDYSFEEIFAKQVRALGNENDVLFAISTSGASSNIIRAIEVAWLKDMHVILLTGNMNDFYKCYRPEEGYVHQIRVPSTETPLIQEAHIMIIHLLCKLIDTALEED
jgi:phosphoheptose isomerase